MLTVRSDTKSLRYNQGATNETQEKDEKIIFKKAVFQNSKKGEPTEQYRFSHEGRNQALNVPCYAPLKAFRAIEPGPNGKYGITFNARHGYQDRPLALPCGQCVGCRLERSRQWAIRCTHEASLYEENCFITLTYDDEHLPKNRSVDVRPLQLFLKRLRKHYPHKIRFYACGEYGELHQRPHYHAILFNHDFPDKVLWKMTNDLPLYNSPTLKKLWPYGHSSVGTVTWNSAAYVARYVMKKVTGEQANDHYQWIDENGEIHQRKPEFTTMSRRPGIGKTWLEKYASDVYPNDTVIMNGKKMRPPKYYDQQFEQEEPLPFKKIKAKRKTATRTHAANNTPARLKVREKVQITRLNQLPRIIE
ncbi:replication initiator protein [Microviridae sp.]|nr:replication initiator protein [Microviridae sp.]